MREVLYVFVAIFFAMPGGKTQLATIAFASRYGWVKACIGDEIGKALPVELIHKRW